MRPMQMSRWRAMPPQPARSSTRCAPAIGWARRRQTCCAGCKPRRRRTVTQRGRVTGAARRARRSLLGRSFLRARWRGRRSGCRSARPLTVPASAGSTSSPREPGGPGVWSRTPHNPSKATCDCPTGARQTVTANSRSDKEHRLSTACWLLVLIPVTQCVLDDVGRHLQVTR